MLNSHNKQGIMALLYNKHLEYLETIALSTTVRRLGNVVRRLGSIVRSSLFNSNRQKSEENGKPKYL
jgi:hypothetical protein